MDPEIKAKWVEALRSGKYTQARGTLKKEVEGSGVSYCCLGVLCEVAGLAYAAWQGIPPEASLDKVGLPDGEALKLTQMNDGCDEVLLSSMSFPVIADYIEKNL